MNFYELCEQQVDLANDVVYLVSQLRMTSFGLSPETEGALDGVLKGLERDVQGKTRNITLKYSRDRAARTTG